MANPTTNYSWVLPTSTDLVTDLPADFDVALQGVDTTLKALNPATTLGDLQYRSSTANTNTRLGIGSTGQVLTVTGGVPTWATAAGGGKLLQVVTATTTTATSISSTTYADVTGMTLNITPSSASSRIMIFWASNVYGSVSAYDDMLPTVYHRLMRGATAISTGNMIMYMSSSATGGNGRDSTNAFAYSWVDSPASTSALTYKFQAQRTAAPGGTTGVSIGYSSYNQSITAFEIGA